MEIQIGQDIRKYKTKDIGNFSLAEAGYLAAAAAVGFVIYKLTDSTDLVIPPMGIILILGFFKPYGLSAWTFMTVVMKEQLGVQCYINETDFEYSADEFPELYGSDVAIPTDWDVIQTSKSVKINKADKQRIAC